MGDADLPQLVTRHGEHLTSGRTFLSLDPKINRLQVMSFNGAGVSLASLLYAIIFGNTPMAILCRGYFPPTAERHRKQHSGEPCRQQAIVRGTSKRSTAIIFFQNCRTQYDPQHPADGRKACSGERGTDELYCLQGNSRAGGVSDWCARVPSSLVLSDIQKVQGITTIRKIRKQIKVNYGGIFFVGT